MNRSKVRTVIFMVSQEERQARIRRFIADLEKQEIVKRNLYPAAWVSGSSTCVYPLMQWRRTIELQWQGNRACPQFIEEMRKRNADLVASGHFVKSDGSCPNKVVFELQPDYHA